MTGFAALPIAEDGSGHAEHSHLSGVSKVLGPRWLQLPSLTVGLLGVQVLWSIEMSYGTPTTPFLLSLAERSPRNTVSNIARPFQSRCSSSIFGGSNIWSRCPAFDWYVHPLKVVTHFRIWSCRCPRR